MDSFISMLGQAFTFLSQPVLGIPMIAYIVIGCVFAMIARFIVGKK